MDEFSNACRDGDIETVTHMVDTMDINKLINIRNKHGDTPLQRAISYGHPKIVKLLIDKGADVNIKLGHESKGNFLHIVSTILDPNVFHPVDPTKKKDYEEIARILIEAGVDATKGDWRGPHSVPTNVKEIKEIYDDYISHQPAEEPAAESTGGSKRRTKKNKRKTKKNKKKSKKARSKKRSRRK